MSGLGNVLDVALSYGYKKAIDILELYSLFPSACPGIKNIDPIPLREQCLKRLGYASAKELKADLKIKAFFLLSDAVNLEMNIQFMCDLAASKDGRIDGGLYQKEFQRARGDA